MTSQSPFLHALPVWPASSSGQMNRWVSFHTGVELPRRARCTLRLAAAQAYRVWANGVFAGRGPARAGHGCARIDEWPLAADATGGLEVIIEVMGYGVPTFCSTLEPEFLCAELIDGKKAFAWTAVHGGGFKAEHRRERVRKVERYSYQRSFVEAYRFGADGITWQMPGYEPNKGLALWRVGQGR